MTQMKNVNESWNGAVETEESDSGDSLFFTQNPEPHPVLPSDSETHLSLRSTPVSQRLFESGSSSESEPEVVQKKRKKCVRLPQYNFSFLKTTNSQLPEDASHCTSRNRAIHYNGIVGYFKCVDQMWHSENGKQAFESTLPTCDSEYEDITPITEDEKSDEEDVKIIDKRLFMYSVKPVITKNSQPWFKSPKNRVSQNPQGNEGDPHFMTKNKSQSSFSKTKVLSKAEQNHLDSDDSDATMIEDDESSTSRGKDASKAKTHAYTPNPTVTWTEMQSSPNHGSGMCALEESENTESQSILQYNPLDKTGNMKNDRSSCPNVTAHKRRYKKTVDVENTEIEAISLNTSQVLDKGQTNKVAAEEKEVADASNGTQEKHKKRHKADTSDYNDEQDFALTNSQMNNMDTKWTEKAKRLLSPSTLEPDDFSTSNEEIVSAEIITPKNKAKKNRSQNTNNHDKYGLEMTAHMSESCSTEANDQSLTVQPSCPNVNDATVQKNAKKICKRKTAELGNAESGTNNLNLTPLQMLDNGQTESNCAEASDSQNGKRKKAKKKRQADRDDFNDEQDVASTKSHLSDTDTNYLVHRRGKSELVDYSAADYTSTRSDESVTARKKKRNFAPVAEKTELPPSPSTHEPDDLCTRDIQSTETITPKKKKNRLHKTNKYAEWDLETVPTEPMSVTCNTDTGNVLRNTGETSCPNVPKSQKKSEDLGSAENDSNSVDKEGSDRRDGKKKHKKKRKGDPSDCNDVPDIVQLQQNRKEKNGTEKAELVSHCISASDCPLTQSDKELSKKKKKKSKVSSPKTVERANLPLSQSAQSQGGDEPGISTNDVDSAETNRLLQDCELGDKIKKKKKKHRKDDNLEDSGSNSKASEEKLCDESKACDSSDVAWFHTDDDDYVKKKKKRKHKNHQPDKEMAAQRQASEAVEESAILSPNATKRKKKKKYSENDEIVETEPEQTTAKRKDIKTNVMKDVDTSPSRRETSISSDRLETSNRRKGKKKLYNPNSENYLEEY